MKATELRIGNLVIEDETQQVGQVDLVIIGIIERELNHTYKPIPLTKEWLDRFNMFNGKEYAYGNYSLRRGNYATSEILDHGWSIGIYNSEGWMFLVCVKYVHQLQNVIFALTAGDVLTEK
jgi:hypothetical protein